MPLIAWLIAAALPGCYSESTFVADYYRAACDLTFECYGEDSLALLPYENADACFDWFTTAEESADPAVECVFDAKSSKTCIDELEVLSCEDFQAGTYPDSCSTVCT